TDSNPRDRLADAYKVLGVDSNASTDEVKKAYRRLMSQHHPDKRASKGLPEEMMEIATRKTQEIKTAYEVGMESRRELGSGGSGGSFPSKGAGIPDPGHAVNPSMGAQSRHPCRSWSWARNSSSFALASNDPGRSQLTPRLHDNWMCRQVCSPWRAAGP